MPGPEANARVSNPSPNDAGPMPGERFKIINGLTSFSSWVLVLRLTLLQFRRGTSSGRSLLANRKFFQVSATDIDEGTNSHILYHIVDGNHDNAFVIEPPFSGLVKTNIVLDREIRDTYRLTIIATDEGSPQLTGTSTLRIDIVDANDNQPTFPPNSVISVSEGESRLQNPIKRKSQCMNN